MKRQRNHKKKVTIKTRAMKNLKVGQKIRAVSICGGALIVGKEYPIKEVLKDQIIIESEIAEIHKFTSEYFDEFFKIIPETLEIPELTGVEMEVSDYGNSWQKEEVYGKTKEGRIITARGIWKFVRPFQPKTIELSLEEIAEKLGVDKVIIKN